jgi:hypothetical protein
MLIIFFDTKEIVHKDRAGQSIPHTTVAFNGECVTMCEDFVPNFGDKITGCCITIMHCFKLPLSPQNFLTESSMAVVPHPPYISLFPRLKMKLIDRHFDTTEVIEAVRC